MKVDVRIMAVRARREKFILPLLESLGLSEDETVIYDDRGRKGDAMYNAKRAWMSPGDNDATHRIVLQDDVELSSGFLEIAEKCADNFPLAVFSFFNTRIDDCSFSPVTPYVKVRGCGVYGQAIMMPKCMIETAFWWIENVYGEGYPHDDIAIGEFARANFIDVMTTCPSVVQHLAPNESQLGYNNKNKRSKVYVRDVDPSFFDTRKFTMSKNIPNSRIPPIGGFRYGSSPTIEELKNLMKKVVDCL